MANFNARITMPAEAKAGEIVEIRVLVRHPMDRGGQVDAEGRVVPRKILKVMEVPVLGSGKTDYVAIQRMAETEAKAA